MSQSILGVRSTNVVPNTREPVSNNHVKADEQDQHHGSVLDVTVNFSDDTPEPQEANNFECTKKRANSLLLFVVVVID